MPSSFEFRVPEKLPMPSLATRPLEAETGELALKADKTVTITGSGLATGGGSLAANRVITVLKASAAEATAGTDDTKAVTPLALATPLNSLDARVDILEAGSQPLPRQLAATGGMDEFYVDCADTVATNITDAAAITFTATVVAGVGLRIALVTASRNVLFSTHSRTGGARTQIYEKFKIEALSGVATIGLSFNNDAGTNRASIFYSSDGRITAGAVSIGTTFPTWTVGDVIGIDYSLNSTGAANVAVRKNGALVQAFALTGISQGPVSFYRTGTSTVVHSSRYEAVSPTLRGELDFAAAKELTTIDRSKVNALHGLLATMRRRVPTGFTPTLPTNFEVYNTAGLRTFFTSINLQPILSEFDPTVTVVYCDAAAPDDTGAGTAASPYKSLATALGHVSNNGRLLIKAKGGLYGGTNSWAGALGATGSSSVLQIVSWDGLPIISSNHEEGLTWASVGSSTYSATYTGAVAKVFDSTILTGAAPDLAASAAVLGRADPGDYQALNLAVSLAACQSTAGTYFISGTTINVHTSDSRVPTGNEIRVYKQGTSGAGNGTFTVLDGTLYMQDISFHGGQSAFFTRISDPAHKQTILARRCNLKYAGANNLAVNGDALIILQECLSAWANSDGYNYHAIFGSAGPQPIEINCVGRWCGRDAAGSNNCSTVHEASVVVRVNGLYHSSEARCIHDIGASFSWNLGVTSRDARNGYSNFCAASSVDAGVTNMWLDACNSSGAAHDIEVTAGKAVVYTAGNFVGTATNIGTPTPYTP